MVLPIHGHYLYSSDYGISTTSGRFTRATFVIKFVPSYVLCSTELARKVGRWSTQDRRSDIG